MSLRVRLALALALVAVVPLAVVAGLLLLQADRRAVGDAAARLDRAKRQAALVIARRQTELRARVARAAADLAADRRAAAPLTQGPASAARDLVRRLANRHALDLAEVRREDGALLATSAAGATPPLAIDVAALADGAVALARMPLTPFAPPPFDPPAGPDAGPAPDEGGPEAIDGPAARGTGRPGGDGADDGRGGGAGERVLVSRATVTLAGETCVVLGASEAGAGFLEEVAAFTGGPAALIGPEGTALAAGGEPEEAVITADVPLAPAGWVLRVAVPAADAARVRRDLVAAFGGVAPMALLSALVLGLLLAAGIARPIRTLAARADALASGADPGSPRRAGPLTTTRDPDEVRSLTRAFDGMLEGLAESERQRIAAERIAAWREVARRVAHEVRNALSPIGLAVENLRRTRARAPEEMDRALEVETTAILDEVGSLSRLVDEFSRFARLPAPQCAPCDLGAIVDQAVAHHRPRIDAARVEVAIARGAGAHMVSADADQIGRALKNILANALDAIEGAGAGGARAPRAGRIDIALTAVEAAPPAGGGASGRFEEIVVRDHGPGLAPEALRMLFEPYFTTRGARGGSGLGLAIVHRVVTEHGGRVTARNAPGGGAEIVVRLPVDGPAAAGGAGASPGEAPAGGRA